MSTMEGLKEWYEEYSGTYDPTVVIVELGNPIPEMIIQDIQLKDCYWKDADDSISPSVSFQYEEVKMVGKKHRIRTFSIEQMNTALSDNDIQPIHPRYDLNQIQSDDIVVTPTADAEGDVKSEEPASTGDDVVNEEL